MATDTTASMPLLKPIVALNLWTFVIEAWMYKMAIPATKKYDIKYTPQFTKQYYYSKVPSEVRWPGDCFTHLMEQPTQFYAISLVLAFLEDQSPLSIYLAWAYVGVRVVHSIIYSGYNNIAWRSRMFRTSSVILVAMGIRAALLVF